MCIRDRTKAGPKGFTDRFAKCMTTGMLSLEPTVESQMKKLQNQKRRREKTLGKASAVQEDEDHLLGDEIQEDA